MVITSEILIFLCNSLLHPPTTFQLIYAHLIRDTFAYLHLPSLEIQPYNPRNDSSYRRNTAAHRTVDQEERAHITANLQQMLGNDPSVQHPPIWRGRHPCCFSKDLHLLPCQKKEHSMRTKQDPSTTLSTGKRMDAMHKHCCSQFNSQGRMWINLDLIQAGYRGQLYGNACILQISSREWNYGETHSLPCTTEQTETENMLLMI